MFFMDKDRTNNPHYSPRTKVGQETKKTICVNLLAGAGAGKSTLATLVHGFCKMNGVTSEYVPEFAKDLAWEGRLELPVNSVLIFGEQHNRQFRLNGKVDCIISDSPLILTSVYNPNDTLFHAFVMQEFRKYENLNFYVRRTKPYIPRGRLGDSKTATKIDNRVMKMLDDNQIPYTVVTGDMDGANQVI